MRTCISFDRVESRSELLECLRRNENSLLLGDEDEATREYFKSTGAPCMIGISSQGHGIKPSGFVDHENAEAWVGYNSKVANLDLRGCATRFVVGLDWVFLAILGQLADGSVIVIYELGACRINRSGQLVWNCTTDVINDYSDRGDYVHLHTAEAELKVDKERGIVL